jgi:hypothetical protein
MIFERASAAMVGPMPQPGAVQGHFHPDFCRAAFRVDRRRNRRRGRGRQYSPESPGHKHVRNWAQTACSSTFVESLLASEALMVASRPSASASWSAMRESPSGVQIVETSAQSLGESRRCDPFVSRETLAARNSDRRDVASQNLLGVLVHGMTLLRVGGFEQGATFVLRCLR